MGTDEDEVVDRGVFEGVRGTPERLLNGERKELRCGGAHLPLRFRPSLGMEFSPVGVAKSTRKTTRIFGCFRGWEMVVEWERQNAE